MYNLSDPEQLLTQRQMYRFITSKLKYITCQLNVEL